MYNVIPRATRIKATQRNTLKNTIDKSKWSSKKCSSNQQEGRKKKRDTEQREHTEDKKTGTNQYWQGCKESVKWCNFFGKQFGSFLKI